MFFGGGKNYSWVDFSDVVSEFNHLNEFTVPLSYFTDRVSIIYLAAGKEDFRFMTYSSDVNLNYHLQEKELSNGDAYRWIVRT